MSTEHRPVEERCPGFLCITGRAMCRMTQILIITVSDPERKAEVYNEMVVQMGKLGWSVVDLQLRQRLKA